MSVQATALCYTTAGHKLCVCFVSGVCGASFFNPDTQPKRCMTCFFSQVRNMLWQSTAASALPLFPFLLNGVQAHMLLSIGSLYNQEEPEATDVSTVWCLWAKGRWIWASRLYTVQWRFELFTVTQSSVMFSFSYSTIRLRQPMVVCVPVHWLGHKHTVKWESKSETLPVTASFWCTWDNRHTWQTRQKHELSI